MIYKTTLRDLRWILPTSLVLGLGLGLLDGNGLSWGVLAYPLLLAMSLYLLTVSWRWLGAGKEQAWVIFLSFALRLAIGVAFTFLLPATGYESPVYQGGYSYEDAYRRDLQAWELSSSGQPLTVIFDKEYAAVDQYGGLMALSALVYRFLSPDAHRSWLVIILSAGIYALGAVFLWRAARLVWGDGVARPASWIYALYPETLLLGSSQMREPFLIVFIALAFWGVVEWQSNHQKLGWLWIGMGFVGMLAFSPGIALAALLVLAGWVVLERRGRAVSWKVLLAVGIIFLTALALFSLAVGRAGSVTSDSLIDKFLQWFRYSSAWEISELERTSPYVDPLFKALPEAFHIPFVAVYGLLQPVLPAALVEPAPWLVMTISILRAVGWFGMLPLLVYGFIAIFKIADIRQRFLWLWLGVTTFAWLLISAIRAGGDQWDNPRYRAIFLVWQALLVGYALFVSRERRDPWLWRILAVEGIFLAFFTQWYIARYSEQVIGKLEFWDMVAWIIGLGASILVGGWLWDLKRRRKDRS